MGNFYTNITLRNVAMESVIAEMRELDRESYVYGGGGVSIVYDSETEKQDTSILSALAEHLATRLSTTAFAVLDHDDDLLWFQLFRQNELLAEYANVAGPPTNVTALATTLATKWSWFRLWFILRRPFIAQISRHVALNKVFGFPEACILGYEYLHRGERTDDMAKGQLVHIEGQGARRPDW